MPEGVPDLVLCWPGRTAAEYAKLGISDYLSRIERYRSCQCLVVPEEPSSRRYSKSHRLDREGRAILRRLAALEPIYTVLVDPRGKMMDSVEFAELLQRQCYDDTRTLAFVVGGPDGVGACVKDRADRLLGLSRMTLPHDMARLVLVEQLYRAFTLIRGHPYNR